MKAVIVDDEELARKRLSGLLAEQADMEVRGIFGTAKDALQYIEENPVEVVFLDISMPEMDGMELANRLLDRGSALEVVFVTAYEEYAIAAFELDAADYLLKPISRDRLTKTVRRLKGTVSYQGQRLCVSCFGGFQVSVENGDEIRWRSPKVEELFAFLICKGSTTREEIADTLWAGFAPDKAMKNINSTIYYIRKALQPYGLEGCIMTTHRQIVINSDKISCDLYRFEALHKIRKEPEELWEQMDSLYRGELFRGKIYEWSFAKGWTLEERLITTLIKTANHWDKQNRREETENLYRRVMELDPFHEEAYERLISIYLMKGQQNRAQRLYEQMELLFKSEMGAVPKKSLRQLFGK